MKNQTNTIVKEVVVEKVKDDSEARQNYGFIFTTAEREEISAAASAKEALEITNKIIKTKMENLQSSKKTASTLNWVLGGLSVASLIALAYLLVKAPPSNHEMKKQSSRKNKLANN